MKKYQKKLNAILKIGFLGLLLSFFKYSLVDTIPSSLASVDFLRICSFLIAFIIPVLMLQKSFFIKKKFIKRFYYFTFIFILLIAFSLFTKGVGNSAFVGNFFGATTINLTVVSIFTFAGLNYYNKFGNKFGLIICVVGYIVCLASLAKWNIVVDIIIPILLYKSWKKRNNVSLSKKILIMASVAALFAFFINNSNSVFTKFAKLNEYDNFEDYINSRILRGRTSSSNLDSGIAFSIGEDGGIKDGARLAMWNDLLLRTTESPLTGLGLGVRAFDYRRMNIEDHSILVFVVARFGMILGVLFLIALYKVIKNYYKIIKYRNEETLTKYIYLALMASFIFQSSVGNIWGQAPVTVMLGVVLFVFIYPDLKTNKIKIYGRRRV